MAAVNFAEIDNHLFKGWVGGGRDLNGSGRERSQMLSAHFTVFGCVVHTSQFLVALMMLLSILGQ